MEGTERKYGHFLTGFLIGGFLSGVAAFLFAPKSGREVRSDIRETRDKVYNEARGFYDKATHRVSDVTERAKNLVARVREKGPTSPQYTAGSPEEMGWES
jgi:gas vesicle protein